MSTARELHEMLIWEIDKSHAAKVPLVVIPLVDAIRLLAFVAPQRSQDTPTERPS